MWLEGFDAFFNNPFSYVQWTVNHNLAGGLGDIRKGRANIGAIDIVDDVPITTYDTLIDSRTDHEALANIMDQMRIGRQGVQEINYGIARKGDQNYVQGWTRDVHQLAAAEEVGLVLTHGVDETIKIMTDTVEGRALRRRIALDTSPSSPKRAIADSDEALKHHLASIEGRAHRIAGGEYHMLNKDGVWVSSKNVHEPLVPQPNHPMDSPYVIVRTGDDELLTIMQEGKYAGGDFRSGRRVSRNKYKGLTNFVETKAATGIGPETVKAATTDTVGRSQSAWEQALEWAFHQLGSKPTNYLSRSPFYRQAHWDAVGRLYHHADDELRAFIDEAVTYSNLDGDFSKIVARHGNIKKVDPSTRVLTIDDADLVDDLAKAQALELTRTTLYDLSKRKNVTDGMRLMFPFGEAFIEMLTVWSRLVTQNPHVIRRGQQMFNSARSSGFFHENERGEEVFTVPGSAFVLGALGIAPEGSNLSIELPVQGFNMITQNPLPGFGHPPQIAAAALLPQTGSLAKIADRVIFGGYARPSGKNPIDFLRSNVVPPWIRNMMTGIGAEDSEWSNSYASTTQDVAEVLAITGAHPGMTNGDHAGLYAEARKKSAFLFIVRGLLSFGSPSPAQLKWEIETNNGSALALRASKEIWGDMLRKHEYERVSATTEFLTRVGFDPNYMYWSHYEEKWERAVTDEGYALELQHAEQYSEYPITANFAYPDPLWAEFSFNVHNMRIRDDDKRVIDEESHRILTNQQGGDLEYRNAIALMEWRANEMRVTGVPKATVTDWERTTKKSITDWTKERWVGWGVDGVIGAFEQSTPQDFWDELTLTKGGWFNDPEMMATHAGQGLAAFMPYWNSARSQSVAEGLTPDGWLSSDRSIPTQMFVREAIEQIIDEHPDFRYLARKAIIPQLSASREAWLQQYPASQLIFDPLSPPDPQAPLTTIPTEMLLEART